MSDPYLFRPSKIWFYKLLNSIPPLAAAEIVCRRDPGRAVSLLRMYENLCSYSPDYCLSKLSLAVISENDPEVSLFRNANTIHYLLYDDQKPSIFQQWDLANDWSSTSYEAWQGLYDFILCEQVIEHLSDPPKCFRNIFHLLRPGGLAHLSVPALNGVHGEPYYFSSGYHPRYLHHLAAEAGFNVLEAKCWGSKRAAQMYATIDWTPLCYSGDLIDFIRLRRMDASTSLLKASRLYITNTVKYFGQSIWGRITDTRSYPVMSWILARKPDD